MSPEEAYRLHTDWGRAVTHPGSPHAEWFDAALMRHCSPLMAGEPVTDGSLFRRFGEFPTFESMLRTGPTMESKVVVSFEEREGPAADAPPPDVFAEETSSPEPMSMRGEQVIVPAQIYRNAVPGMLAGASTYYVTADMCTIIEVAAAAFDQFDRMPRLPRDTGFVVLARPILLPMPGGDHQPVRAFAWDTWGTVATSTGETGMAGEVWTFASRRADKEFETVRDAAGQWPSKTAWKNDPDLLPCFSDWFVAGAPLPPLAETVAENNARTGAHAWLRRRFANPGRDADGAMILPTPEEWSAKIAAGRARYDQLLAGATPQERTDELGYFQRYLAAFVLLLSQQITVARDEEPAGKSVELAHRVSPRRPSTVTVVNVRSGNAHHSDDAENPTGAKRGALTHRHLVGSHWKWQPYGKERALRRRIFVAGYVRGPEDSPLVVNPRVTRLS